jgi:hypothetical protein
MKTTNNVQKTTLRSAAVIASFILISLTVSAQNFWRELLINNSFGDIAVAMVNNPAKHSKDVSDTKSVSTVWFIDYLEDASDKSLNIEDWMLDESNFFGKTLTNEVVTEKSLELENWMTNQNYFGKIFPKTFSNEEVKEEQLQLESWMIEDKFWK